jgi:squalene-hopene/tetraprenyl-beta-curcumene cyclase
MSVKQGQTKSVAPRFGRMDAALADVESAIHRSSDYLLSLQHPEGYWGGELEADSML